MPHESMSQDYLFKLIKDYCWLKIHPDDAGQAFSTISDHAKGLAPLAAELSDYVLGDDSLISGDSNSDPMLIEESIADLRIQNLTRLVALDKSPAELAAVVTSYDYHNYEAELLMHIQDNPSETKPVLKLVSEILSAAFIDNNLSPTGLAEAFPHRKSDVTMSIEEWSNSLYDSIDPPKELLADYIQGNPYVHQIYMYILGKKSAGVELGFRDNFLNPMAQADAILYANEPLFDASKQTALAMFENIDDAIKKGLKESGNEDKETMKKLKNRDGFNLN